MYAVTWETQKTVRDRRALMAAVVDANGAVIGTPVVVRKGYSAPAGAGVVWNGSAFTLVTCDDLGASKIFWGELTATGAYKKQGEAKIPITGDLRFCTRPVAATLA